MSARIPSTNPPAGDEGRQCAHLAAQQTAIKSIVKIMSQRVELDVLPVFEECLAQTVQALGAGMACLHLADGENGVLNLVHSRDLGQVWSRAWRRLEIKGSSAPALAHKGQATVILTGEDAPAGLGGVVSAPVRGAELGLGSLTILWPPEVSLNLPPEQAGFLETVGELLGLSIEHAGLVAELVDRLGEVQELKTLEERRGVELGELNRQLTEANRRLEELSFTDPLTGIFNRRYFLGRLEEEVARSKRQGHPLCLVMADLDHFKRINDTLGHPAGDKALKRFADWLKSGVRRVDLVGRYGGEEFVLLLLDCGLKRGVAVADKLRREVSRRSVEPPFDQLGGFTVSMGVAQMTPACSGAEGLLARADEAMYKAKRAGRDRVEVAED